MLQSGKEDFSSGALALLWSSVTQSRQPVFTWALGVVGHVSKLGRGKVL